MDPEHISRCIICNSESLSGYLTCEDHFVTHKSFTLCKCDSCGFCFTSPRPFIYDAKHYYESESYISHSKTSQGIINKLFHIARKYTIRSKNRITKKYSAGKNILDYGCGTGEFLNELNKKAWSCKGIEPNRYARKHAIEAYGLEVLEEDELHDMTDESLDCITLWHVIEHIYPLEERLESFHSKLNADGTLIAALPNMNAYDAKKYGKHWAAYDVPRHIYHFTPDTIISLMQKHGFRHVKTKPMLLDSFYISLLSEKYKHGSNNFLSAVFFGLVSNLYALFGNRNYSSLIYIFKKSK